MKRGMDSGGGLLKTQYLLTSRGMGGKRQIAPGSSRETTVNTRRCLVCDDSVATISWFSDYVVHRLVDV
jgi:hypothetical protein